MRRRGSATLLLPGEVMALQDKLERQALAAANSNDRSLGAAKLVHDACFFSFLWGHMPPPRIGSVCEITHPNWSLCPENTCLREDCMVRQETCRGNRLLWGTTARNPFGPPRLHLPHHKNEGRWGGESPPPYLLPMSMQPLLGHLLLWARARLQEWTVFAQAQVRGCAASESISQAAGARR